MPKIEPAIRQLVYLIPDGTSYIDIAKDLSKVNRRLYRQGMSYVIQDIQIGMPVGMRATDVYQVVFATAGTSWIVHNAWKKAFTTWQAQARSVERLVDIPAKWRDFKVYLDDSMRGGTTLEPYAGDGAVYLAGEWNYSQFVWDDDGTERETYAHLIGSDSGTTDFGLVQNYADSRKRVQANDPAQEAEASTSMYAKMLTIGDDELIADLIDNIEAANDAPPYDIDDFPGGADNADAAVPVRFGSVNATQSTTNLPGFVAECGLIKVSCNEIELTTSGDPAAVTGTSVYQAVSAPTVSCLITVAAGPYRGVLAAPMGQ
uniref:Uncharacterized protein n=1 Tax=uncultured marine virus TaxID=186617 RepID=S4TE45_9VIRU|nr:hypothetical protein [uncultured marine virus]